MNVKFLNKFKYWNKHDGKNYTLDTDGKSIRYIHENKNIVAEIEYLEFENKDNQYICTILNIKEDSLMKKSNMISNKEKAFEKLSYYMKEWDTKKI